MEQKCNLLLKFKYFSLFEFYSILFWHFSNSCYWEQGFLSQHKKGALWIPIFLSFCISKTRRNCALFFCVFWVNRHPKERRPILCLCFILSICQSQIYTSNTSKVESLFVLLFQPMCFSCLFWVLIWITGSPLSSGRKK